MVEILRLALLLSRQIERRIFFSFDYPKKKTFELLTSVEVSTPSSLVMYCRTVLVRVLAASTM